MHIGKRAQNGITSIENYENVVSYVHIPQVPQMHERSEAERRATTGPTDDFDKGRPGVARSAP